MPHTDIDRLVFAVNKANMNSNEYALWVFDCSASTSQDRWDAFCNVTLHPFQVLQEQMITDWNRHQTSKDHEITAIVDYLEGPAEIDKIVLPISELRHHVEGQKAKERLIGAVLDGLQDGLLPKEIFRCVVNALIAASKKEPLDPRRALCAPNPKEVEALFLN